MEFLELIAQVPGGSQGPAIPWYTQWTWIAAPAGAVMAALIAAWALLRKQSDPVKIQNIQGLDEVRVGRMLGAELDKRLGPVRVAEAQAAFDKGKQEAQEAAKDALKDRDQKIGKLEAQLAAKETVPVGAEPDALASVTLFNLGLEAQKAHRLEEGIGLYSASILLDPKLRAAYSNRGAAKSDLGDQAGAIQDYDKAIELDPKYAMAYSNRGVAKYALGDKAGGLQDYDKAIELDPKFASPYNNRGNAKSALGDKAGGIQDYDTAIELDPKFAKAYYNRGHAKSDLGDQAGGIQDYDTAIELDPKDAIAYSNRGAAKSDLDDKAGAIQDYDKAIEIDPKFAAAYYNKACAYAKENKNEMAVRNLETAIALDRTFREMAKADADFDSIREYPAFKRLME